MLSAHLKLSGDRPETQERLDDLTTECDSLRSQVTCFKKEIEIHKSERAQLKETNDELTNKNKSLEEKNERLTDELKSFDELHNKLEDMNHINMKLKNNIIKLEQSTKEMDIENKNLQKQIEEYQLKSIEIERETRKQTMDNNKQRELEQNATIQVLRDQVHILESQLNNLNLMKTRAITTMEDDEKVPIITKNYLPALMQDKTLIVGDKTSKSDKNTVSASYLYNGPSSEPSTSMPEPVDTVPIYNHNHVRGNSGLPFAGIGSVTSHVSAGDYIEYIGDQNTDIFTSNIPSLTALSTTSTTTIGGTVFLDGNDLNTNVAVVIQQKQYEYNLKLLVEKQKHEREIQELTERNGEKMMDLMKDIEELQSKKIEYENKMEIMSKQHSDKMVEQIKEYEQRIKIIKKEDDYYMDDIDITKYQQLRKEIIDLKNENQKLKLRLSNAWELCITPAWFASDNID